MPSSRKKPRTSNAARSSSSSSLMALFGNDSSTASTTPPLPPSLPPRTPTATSSVLETIGTATPKSLLLLLPARPKLSATRWAAIAAAAAASAETTPTTHSHQRRGASRRPNAWKSSSPKYHQRQQAEEEHQFREEVDDEYDKDESFVMEQQQQEGAYFDHQRRGASRRTSTTRRNAWKMSQQQRQHHQEEEYDNDESFVTGQRQQQRNQNVDFDRDDDFGRAAYYSASTKTTATTLSAWKSSLRRQQQQDDDDDHAAAGMDPAYDHDHDDKGYDNGSSYRHGTREERHDGDVNHGCGAFDSLHDHETLLQSPLREAGLSLSGLAASLRIRHSLAKHDANENENDDDPNDWSSLRQNSPTPLAAARTRATAAAFYQDDASSATFSASCDSVVEVPQQQHIFTQSMARMMLTRDTMVTDAAAVAAVFDEDDASSATNSSLASEPPQAPQKMTHMPSRVTAEPQDRKSPVATRQRTRGSHVDDYLDGSASYGLSSSSSTDTEEMELSNSSSASVDDDAKTLDDRRQHSHGTKTKRNDSTSDAKSSSFVEATSRHKRPSWKRKRLKHEVNDHVRQFRFQPDESDGQVVDGDSIALSNTSSSSSSSSLDSIERAQFKASSSPAKGMSILESITSPSTANVSVLELAAAPSHEKPATYLARRGPMSNSLLKKAHKAGVSMGNAVVKKGYKRLRKFKPSSSANLNSSEAASESDLPEADHASTTSHSDSRGCDTSVDSHQNWRQDATTGWHADRDLLQRGDEMFRYTGTDGKTISMSIKAFAFTCMKERAKPLICRGNGKQPAIPRLEMHRRRHFKEIFERACKSMSQDAVPEFYYIRSPKKLKFSVSSPLEKQTAELLEKAKKNNEVAQSLKQTERIWNAKAVKAEEIIVQLEQELEELTEHGRSQCHSRLQRQMDKQKEVLEAKRAEPKRLYKAAPKGSMKQFMDGIMNHCQAKLSSIKPVIVVNGEEEDDTGTKAL